MLNNILIQENKVKQLCYLSDEALALLKNEKLANYKKNNINRALKTSAILNDFFKIDNFQNKHCIEVGPGRYEFSQMARYLGANVMCIERSSEIASLGRYLGFNVIESEFFSYFKNSNLLVDGLFVKNIQDPCANSLDDADKMAKILTDKIKTNGWGLCVLRNRFDDEELMDLNSYGNRYLTKQKESFLKQGWQAIKLDPLLKNKYGLKVKAAKWIFLKNLESV
ncbi:MAG: hypothetical protein ACOCQD_03985 [archaeon]